MSVKYNACVAYLQDWPHYANVHRQQLFLLTTARADWQYFSCFLFFCAFSAFLFGLLSLWIICTVDWDSHIEDMPVSQPKALNCKRSWPLQLQLLVLSRGQIDKFIELYFCLSREKVFQKLFKFKCNSLRPIVV